MKILAAVAMVGTLSYAGMACAAVQTTSYSLPAGSSFEHLSPGIELGDLKGRYTVTIRSTRSFLNLDAWTSEMVDWSVVPESGPGFGDTYFEDNMLGYRAGAHAIAIDFQSFGSTQSSGCCEWSGSEWVPYDEYFKRTSLLFADIDFAAGDAPITVTVSVAAVPEPATWAMMIVGFGLSGAALRRSRRAVEA